MPIGELCNREVVIVPRSSSILEAARLMRQFHVGDLVVCDKREGGQVPVGVVTDRDLVLEVLAPELDPEVITVGDILNPQVVSVKEDAGVFESIQYMRAKGVRRLPVVDSQGRLMGILTLDDMLELLSEELHDLVNAVKHEQSKETASRH